VYLHGDVFSGCELLADGGQRRLVHLPDAAVQNLDGVVTFPLARGLLPEEEEGQEEEEEGEETVMMPCQQAVQLTLSSAPP